MAKEKKSLTEKLGVGEYDGGGILSEEQRATDLAGYDVKQLEKLAQELREQIIQVCASNGGHLAPSLGTVELTLALLKVFDPKKTPIVWDVGHQSYAYKILTGRKQRFHTLRQFGGISGFNNIFESEYDAFSVGHSSTSISAALGLARAYPNEKVVAVIGDGALTGGMAFEAINHAGQIRPENLIVVLNDNQMSISPNVGGVQKALTNFLVSKSYNFFKKEAHDLSKLLPENIRKTLLHGSKKMEESLLNIFSKSIFFEDFGFTYIGPVNGHNLAQLVKLLTKIDANVKGPVLVHTITQKGKGYEFAEKDPQRFHGVSPFEIASGKAKKGSERGYGSVLGESLYELAQERDDVCAVVAAMTQGVGLEKFSQDFAERFYDVGIAEQHAVTFAAGLARGGKKVFVAIYSTFMQRAFDQMIHDVAMQKLPIVVCLDRAGLVGADGATHHGVFDLAFLRMIPGLVVLAPASGQELGQMLQWAAECKDAPVAIRYPRGKALSEDFGEFVLGRAKREGDGKQVGICAIGAALADARQLAEIMQKDGVGVRILRYNCLKPFDAKILQEAVKDGVREFITLEDGVACGGFGSCVSEHLCCQNVRVMNFGYPDEFVPHGTVDELKNSLGLKPSQIYKKYLQGREV